MKKLSVKEVVSSCCGAEMIETEHYIGSKKLRSDFHCSRCGLSDLDTPLPSKTRDSGKEVMCPGCGYKILVTLDNGKTLLCYNTKCELYGREIPSETNEADYLKEFDKFIKEWTGQWYPHLSDTDENDGQRMREAYISSIERARREGVLDERQRVVEIIEELRKTKRL